MKLACVGLNWKTPVGIREQVAFDDRQLPDALRTLKERWPASEFALLSTCNRTELYSASRESAEAAGLDQLCDFIAHFHNRSLPTFFDHLYFHEDTSVALHLFKVASGLDSLVLGEGQILGQVRQTYQTATDQRTVGPLLHGLFQRALSVAKKVQSETGLTKGRLSIASAAVDYLKGVFDHFTDKRVLVIGAGKMAELVVAHLRELRPLSLVVCNRNRPRAEAMVAKTGGLVRPFEELRLCLTESDIVVSSTGAEEPIVTVAEFREVMKARRNRLTAIVDIAVPRDFEAGIGDLDNVLLWNIDDLEKIRHHTLRSREAELEKALHIVDAEADAFQSALNFLQTGTVIGRLEREYERILERELEWLMPQLNGIPDDQRRKIRHFAHRVKSKFLHPPKAALRAEARHGHQPTLLDAFRRLFGLYED